MILLASINDKEGFIGEVFATTWKPIGASEKYPNGRYPFIDCWRPTKDISHGIKYHGWSQGRYITEYYDLLKGRQEDVMEWLWGLRPDQDMTLLCFCKPIAKRKGQPGDHLCHRELIAKMIAHHRPDIEIVLR